MRNDGYYTATRKPHSLQGQSMRSLLYGNSVHTSNRMGDKAGRLQVNR
jgi:hypothetical protein